MFSRDNHKIASWVIEIEVIYLIQDKIYFAWPLQVCNVILSGNYFIRFERISVHGDSQTPKLFTF